MKRIAASLFWFFAQLGGLGLLGLGALDSSILFAPLGNDLLMVALTANRPERWLLYAALATVGSLLGVLFTDLLARKGGEAGLERRVSRRRLEYVKRKVKNNAAWALALAAVMPPPFPFTPFVAAAAALQYPRKKLLAIIGAGRIVRFGAVGLLAVTYGRRILEMAERPEVQGVVLAVLAVAVIGSGVSIARWVRGSRRARNSSIRNPDFIGHKPIPAPSEQS